MIAAVAHWTWLEYFLAGVSLYYAFLFSVSLLPRPATGRPFLSRPAGAGPSPLMVVLVPAHDEELVIGDTLDSLGRLDYPDCVVVVVDDHSTDGTGRVVAERSARSPVPVVHIRRTTSAGRGGKGGALNHGYRAVLDMIDRPGSPLAGRRPDDVIVVVVDADGQLDRHTLARVAPYFDDPAVGAVQIGVRIANARDSLLARLQDMEFVGFSGLVQVARDRLGSVALGGNGQFTRLSALVSLGRDPWSPRALSEDLDLGLALTVAGWRTRFCADAFVAQQGLVAWRPLLRQRTRWIQGHYQCWRRIPQLLRARDLPAVTRLDLSLYLFLVVTVVLVAANLLAGLLMGTGLVRPPHDIFAWAPAGAAHRAVVFFFSFCPLLCLVATYQRFATEPLRVWEAPAYALAFTAYSYVWVVATVRAWGRMASRRGGWVKTPRTAAAEPA